MQCTDITAYGLLQFLKKTLDGTDQISANPK